MSATGSDSIFLTVGIVGAMVAVATLSYTWYSWLKKRLDRSVRLIDEVRVWALYPQLLTIEPPREEPLRLNYLHKEQRDIARLVAHHLAIATGRAAVVTSQNCYDKSMELTRALHRFATQDSADSKTMMDSWQSIFLMANDVQNLATNSKTDFRISKTYVLRKLGLR